MELRLNRRRQLLDLLRFSQQQIDGTADWTGGSGTYHVEVADNGEPGRNDTFALALSNGYGAAGTLDGGNIQLHCK